MAEESRKMATLVEERTTGPELRLYRDEEHTGGVRRIEKLNKQNLILLRGPGGVGKSTLGDLLEEEIPSSLHIDVDRLKVQARDETSNFYKRNIGRLAADLFIQDAMDEGRPLVVTECFVDSDYLDHMKRLGEEGGYDPQTFYIHGSLDTCIERNKSRSKNLPDSHIESRYREMEPNEEDRVVLNENGNPDRTVQQILSYIESEPVQSEYTA